MRGKLRPDRVPADCGRISRPSEALPGLLPNVPEELA